MVKNSKNKAVNKSKISAVFSLANILIIVGLVYTVTSVMKGMKEEVFCLSCVALPLFVVAVGLFLKFKNKK